MGFTASDVKKLREMSGAGMLDCQKALKHTDGDVTAAVKYLKEQGLAAATSRQGRTTGVGRVFIAQNSTAAVMVELMCETDFVARNTSFIELGESLAQTVLALPGGGDIEQATGTAINEGISVIKENIKIRRTKRFPVSDSQFPLSYIHGDDGGLGALVLFATSAGGGAGLEKLREQLFGIVLHVAAFRPQFLAADKIPNDVLEEQRSIFMQQAKGLDKPDNVIEKIIFGKMKKYAAEISLLEQPYVRNDKISVKQYLEQVAKESGQEISIAEYSVLRSGEEE